MAAAKLNVRTMKESEKSWCKVTDSDGNDVTDELTAFADIYGLERAASGRYSLLLLYGLYYWAKVGRLNPAKVMEEIEALEGLRQSSRTKPASVFTRNQPLKGLWHKHYLEDGLPSMAINLQKGMRKYGIPFAQQMVEEAENSGEKRYFSEKDIPSIVHDLVEGNWKRLMSESALTGQWIIFAQHDGKNYYLCLASHTTGDQKIRDQIDAICVQEFPFLKGVLSQTEDAYRDRDN